MKTTFWDWVIKTFYVIPGQEEMSAHNSLVLTLDSQTRYLPIQDENNIPIQIQAIWLGIYLLLWITLVFFIGTNKASNLSSNWSVYFLGFVSGLIMILLESFMFTKINLVKILRDSLKPVTINTPYIKDIKKGTNVTEPNKFINYAAGAGDYKVIFDDKTIPHDGIHGYIFTADTYLNKISKGEIVGMNLEDYLVQNGNENGDIIGFQAKNQEDVVYFSQRIESLSRVAYYISIIIITWAIYITSSKWGTRHKLKWIMLSFMVSIIAGAVVVESSDIVSFNNIIFLKKRLLIYAISIGITSIFI